MRLKQGVEWRKEEAAVEVHNRYNGNCPSVYSFLLIQSYHITLVAIQIELFHILNYPLHRDIGWFINHFFDNYSFPPLSHTNLRLNPLSLLLSIVALNRSDTNARLVGSSVILNMLHLFKASHILNEYF